MLGDEIGVLNQRAPRSANGFASEQRSYGEPKEDIRHRLRRQLHVSSAASASSVSPHSYFLYYGPDGLVFRSQRALSIVLPPPKKKRGKKSGHHI